MAGESGNVDEDYFGLGTITAGETILLSLRIPRSSTLKAVVEVRDSTGKVISIAPSPSTAVARADITATGTYYARVLAWSGQGSRGQYVLDASVWPAGTLDVPDLAVASVDAAVELLQWRHRSCQSGPSALRHRGRRRDEWFDRIELSKNDVGETRTTLPDVDRAPWCAGAGRSYQAAATSSSHAACQATTGSLSRRTKATRLPSTFSRTTTSAGRISGGRPTDPRCGSWLQAMFARLRMRRSGKRPPCRGPCSNSGEGVTGTGRPGGIVSEWSDRVVLSVNTIFGDSDDVLLADVARTGPSPPETRTRSAGPARSRRVSRTVLRSGVRRPGRRGL